MLEAGKGLKAVPTAALRTLLRFVHRESDACPLDAPTLARYGVQEYQERLLGALRGLDRRGVQAVLVCVIAERGEPR